MQPFEFLYRTFHIVFLWPLMGLLTLSACGQEPQDVTNSSSGSSGEVVDRAEVMPRFPGCEEMDLSDDETRYRCSVQLLMDYIGRGISYPPEAKKNQTTGEAVVQFIIQTDGTVEFSKILQDPGDGLGAVAESQIRRMTREGIIWRPGYKDGKPVAVRFNLPVKFTLPRDPDTGKIPGEN
ncbi:MAG: energy transducer TonB [Saprospiraceae bacterium]|nr:energy transducer TonB [Saprospiraceae bacterium]